MGVDKSTAVSNVGTNVTGITDVGCPYLGVFVVACLAGNIDIFIKQHQHKDTTPSVRTTSVKSVILVRRR